MRITGTAVLSFGLLAAGVLPGQETLHVESTLVVVPVAVTDKANRFVVGLEKQNFRLYEDGVEQKISQFAGEDVPLSIGILVDISASMTGRVGTSRQAVAEFLKTMNKGDEAFLEEFNDKATLEIPMTRTFEDIKSKMAEVKPDGTTALIDAVDLGVTTIKDAHNPRKALLLVSDGGENSSHYTAEAIKEAIQRADVQVYAMGVFDPLSKLLGMTSGGMSGPEFLGNLCEQTGGRVYAAGNYAALPTVARRIGIELRNQYVLAFAPQHHDHSGEYRKLEVKVTPPEGVGEVKVRWRNGYYEK